MMDKPMEPFFTQLRRLAANVERQTEQYGQLVTEKKQEFSAPETKKIISDMRSDIKQHKALSQSLLDTEQQHTELLQGILSSTDALLKGHLLKNLTETEQYLSQYGFQSYEEVHGSKKTEEQENEVKDTNIQHHTTPNKKPPQDPNRTPRLEDAGISQQTLQYLISLKKHKSPTNVPVSQIPADFLHDGIICTPSLARSLKWTSDNSACDLHSALASPTLLYSSKPMPAIEETLPNPTSHLQMNMNAMASPLSPVFCTPGIKQILTGKKIKEEISADKTFVVNKRPVNVGLFQSDAKIGIAEVGCKWEPAVPDLTTQQYDDDDEPVEPELTFSLEALSEMTGMFKINPLSKPVTAVIPSTTKHIVNDNKENATPPEPEMLMDRRILQLKSKAAPQPNTDFERFQQSYDDAPPSPKLFGTYKFS